ncbi:hypothetical protein HELRODRAFT_194315 [Helobdella robusta]|uniref:SHSP domain-containing protein n=1 Tax=Helobdella robusta TaxID=6412 RepID=T1FVX2_HELRO|nr:hypothetical protein HELRODRAFT_194315 [Helobdella robusta]ESN92279.1 hypothetical protein HELRODRAFT_194315 [Helobdella robusta]
MYIQLQAVFRKFLSATKNKIKPPNINTMKVDGGSSGACSSGGSGKDGATAAAAANNDNCCAIVDEEFESRKQEWQEELDQMSDFLVLKSTEEQREEGVASPVDTAYLDDKDGMPVLKACFDVQHFKPDEVQLSVENGILTVFAQSLQERDVAVFKKTMIRRLEIPSYVDHQLMQCVLSHDQKILTIEMPFHLPPQKRPIGPTVVPVFSDERGRRKIRLVFSVGRDFTEDDVTLTLDRNRPQCLTVDASYEAEVGPYAAQVTRRQFRKRFRLPDFVNVDTLEQSLSEDGELFVDILLKDDPSFQFKITTEKVTENNYSSNDYRVDSSKTDKNQLNSTKTAQRQIDSDSREEDSAESKVEGGLNIITPIIDLNDVDFEVKLECGGSGGGAGGKEEWKNDGVVATGSSDNDDNKNNGDRDDDDNNDDDNKLAGGETNEKLLGDSKRTNIDDGDGKETKAESNNSKKKMTDLDDQKTKYNE